MRHVRTTNSRLAELIQRALEASQTFRREVDRINQSDNYVFIVDGRCLHNERACLTVVTMADTHRMLWVTVDAAKRDPDWVTMGSIAHELRHVIEVIDDASVRSTPGLHFLYERIGFHTNAGAFETNAAIETGEDVRGEVRQFRRARAR